MKRVVVVTNKRTRFENICGSFGEVKYMGRERLVGKSPWGTEYDVLYVQVNPENPDDHKKTLGMQLSNIVVDKESKIQPSARLMEFLMSRLVDKPVVAPMKIEIFARGSKLDKTTKVTRNFVTLEREALVAELVACKSTMEAYRRVCDMAIPDIKVCPDGLRTKLSPMCNERTFTAIWDAFKIISRQFEPGTIEGGLWFNAGFLIDDNLRDYEFSSVAIESIEA